MRLMDRVGWHRYAMSRCALVVVLTATTGCATLRSTLAGYDTGENGISRSQQRLRNAIAAGDYVIAMGWKENDHLLETLNVGIASYYAAEYARSGAALDTAALLADDRITTSLSKDALSMVTNDLARPYQPGRTERLFIPYYGMLAYAKLGAWEDAAVEARRLAGLLAQYAVDRDDGERSLHAALYYLTGAVFERAGNRGEAEVSYRAAHALSFAFPDSVLIGDSTGQGDLLVLVERGFVAHRTTASIDMYLGDSDRDSLAESDAARRRTVERMASASSTWGSDIGHSSAARRDVPEWMGFTSGHHHDDDDGHYLTIAFPVLRSSAAPWGGAMRLTADEQPIPGAQLVVAVDDARAADERRDRVSIATRAIARAAAKFVVTKAIRDRKGEAAGTVAELTAALLERADVRSWHLLPQQLTLVRVRLPAGTHDVRLLIGGVDDIRTVDLGHIAITAGAVSIAPTRLWRDPAATPLVSEPVVAERSGCTGMTCP